jgi:hypothetical protein
MEDDMANWEEKELTVLVKTYPNLSKKYEELVCVAGIDSEGNWIRLYPVPYRDLRDNQKFRIFQKASVRCTKATNDPRPESHKVEYESIKLGEVYGSTGADLNTRRLVVSQGFVGSMCDLLEKQRADKTSLGVIKPHELLDFIIEPVSGSEKWDDEVKLRATQNSLFNPERFPLEEPKYSFKYKYRCENEDCTTHTQSITSWEIQQAYRSWRDEKGEDRALEMIREKWAGQMWQESKDTQFFVGSVRANPQGFLVLGVFWPPKGATQQRLL